MTDTTPTLPLNDIDRCILVLTQRGIAPAMIRAITGLPLVEFLERSINLLTKEAGRA